uniref:Uncharacterized protein n=1 Tax=mine drainage metagenome TaxID=410659 RepID=E6QGI5_9ZZZZ
MVTRKKSLWLLSSTCLFGTTFCFFFQFYVFSVAYNSPHPQTGIVATISGHGTNYYITKRQKQEKQITWDAMFLFTFIGGLAYYGYKQTVRIQP